MKISTEPTCPGHKGNQDSLNENQAVRLMRTLIYFIFPLYFISVSLDAANQQVFIECVLCAQLGPSALGTSQAARDVLCNVWLPDQQWQNQLGTLWKCKCSALPGTRESAHLGMEPTFRLSNSPVVIPGQVHVWEPRASSLVEEAQNHYQPRITTRSPRASSAVSLPEHANSSDQALPFKQTQGILHSILFLLPPRGPRGFH